MTNLVKQREVALDEQWIEFRHVTLLNSETCCHRCQPNLANIWRPIRACYFISPRVQSLQLLGRPIALALGARSSSDDPLHFQQNRWSHSLMSDLLRNGQKARIQFITNVLLRTSFHYSEGPLWSSRSRWMKNANRQALAVNSAHARTYQDRI